MLGELLVRRALLWMGARRVVLSLGAVALVGAALKANKSYLIIIFIKY